MADRPLTQRELKKQKQAKKEIEYVTIENIDQKMNVPIQLKAPEGVDFYRGEQTIYIAKGKSSKFPKHRLIQKQIENLQKKRIIRVIG